MARVGRLIGLMAIAGTLVVSGATAAAADELPPNCTAADLAAVLTGVSAATTAYLFPSGRQRGVHRTQRGDPGTNPRTSAGLSERQSSSGRGTSGHPAAVGGLPQPLRRRRRDAGPGLLGRRAPPRMNAGPADRGIDWAPS